MPTLEERVALLEGLFNASKKGSELPQSLDFDENTSLIIHDAATDEIKKVPPASFKPPQSFYGQFKFIQNVPNDLSSTFTDEFVLAKTISGAFWFVSKTDDLDNHRIYLNDKEEFHDLGMINRHGTKNAWQITTAWDLTPNLLYNFNRWFQRGYLKASINIDTENGEIYNYPLAKKGETFVWRVTEGNDIPMPNGSFRLGGANGILVGHDSYMICMQDSPGGSYSSVGSRYFLINNKKQDIIQYWDHESDFPAVGQQDIIYVALDVNITFYWNPDSNEYDQIGETVRGTLISSVAFEDEGGVTVTPAGNKIYIDINTNKAYHWNGASYVEISPEKNETIWVDELPSTGIQRTIYVRESDDTMHRWIPGTSFLDPGEWRQISGGSRIKIGDKFYLSDTNPIEGITVAYNVWFDDTTLAPVAQYIGTGDPDGSTISDWKKKGNTILIT